MPTRAMPGRWYQFRLRTILLATAVVAVYLSLESVLGYVRPLLLLAGLFVGGKACRGARNRRLWSAAGLVAAAALLWFATVAKEVRAWDCSRCWIVRGEISYCVCGFTVYRQTVNLGRPRPAAGPHPHVFVMFQEYSYWGLVFPVFGPHHFRGTRRLT